MQQEGGKTGRSEEDFFGTKTKSLSALPAFPLPVSSALANF
jgi:hypothetical protein